MSRARCFAFVLAACVAFAPLGWVRAAQDAPGAESSEEERALQAKIEKYLDLAQTGRVSVRPQAARRLVKLGEPAALRVLEACGENGEQLPALGPYMVEVLADFERPELRAMLWSKLADLDFPWRGPAARSLSHKLQRSEVQAFLERCDDPLDQVRLAVVDACAQLAALALSPDESGARAQLVTRAHTDPSDRVRRAAALQLDEWGEPAYLMWLIEDLTRTDSYFRLPLGEQARFASIRGLKARLGDDFGFKAEDSPHTPANAKAIETLTGAVLARIDGEPPSLPELALTAGPTPGDVLGLELRSCRVGEFFLRWNRSDVLYVGTGRARAIPLEAGSVARLESALAELAKQLGETRYWGEAGCDIEQLRIVDGAGDVQTFLVSKGQAAVPDLRPEALDRAVRLLVDSIPEDAGDPLRADVTRALQLLGGSF